MNRPYVNVLNANHTTVRLFLGDCITGMNRLPAHSADVVVTSPPYNIGANYHEYRDNLPHEGYLSWMTHLGENVKRILAKNGSFFLNIGSTPKNPWTPLDVAQQLRDTFVLQNMIHWVKSIGFSKNDVGKYPNVTGDIAVGHYKPIGGNRFLNDAHEFIFHFTNTGNTPLDRLSIGIPYQDKSNIGRWKQSRQDLRCRGNTWFIPYETIWNRVKQRPHPTTFPERLPEMCIQLHGVTRTRLVLDPFIGLGSTALAAMRLGVSCIGFEIDSGYLDEARRRLEEHTHAHSAYTASYKNETNRRNSRCKLRRETERTLDTAS